MIKATAAFLADRELAKLPEIYPDVTDEQRVRCFLPHVLILPDGDEIKVSRAKLVHLRRSIACTDDVDDRRWHELAKARTLAVLARLGATDTDLILVTLLRDPPHTLALISEEAARLAGRP